LESKKGLNPVCVSFGSDKIFIGYGYTSKRSYTKRFKIKLKNKRGLAAPLIPKS